LDDQPVVLATPARIALLAGQMRFHPLPLVVLQDQTNPGHSILLCEKELESDFRLRGNPECQRALEPLRDYSTPMTTPRVPSMTSRQQAFPIATSASSPTTSTTDTPWPATRVRQRP